MGSLPLHPMIVHLPIALGVLMPLIAAAILWAWWRGVLPRPAWWGAVALQGMLVLSGVAALRSGEADEERVEEVVPESAIELHEEAAQVFVAGAGLVLALAIAAALLKDEARAKQVAIASAAGTLLVLYLGYRVGEAGGELVYRHDAAAAWASAGAPSEAGGEAGEAEEEDDDD